MWMLHFVSVHWYRRHAKRDVIGLETYFKLAPTNKHFVNCEHCLWSLLSCCVLGRDDWPAVRPDTRLLPHSGQLHRVPWARLAHHHSGEAYFKVILKQTRIDLFFWLSNCLKKWQWHWMLFPKFFTWIYDSGSAEPNQLPLGETIIILCACSYLLMHLLHVPAAESVPEGMQSGQLL